MAPDFDGLIIGTGHNALVLQAYLCRAGLRILAIDRADRPGGGLTTVQRPAGSGFLHNEHSFFHRAITAMPWFRDLELARHGVRYIEPAFNVAMLLPGGGTLEWWTDLDRTVESFARLSPRDAATLRRWTEEFRPIVERILFPEAQSPPLEPVRRRELLSRSALGRKLLETAALSPLEFVEREFEHDAIRAGLLFFNGLREVDLRLKGFGHSIPMLMANPHKAQMVAGGSARLAEALVADIREHGGEIRVNCEPRSILTRGGRAVGVELHDGHRIEARSFVASNLNPQQTFLDLIDADTAGSRLREQAEAFQWNVLAPLFALTLNLHEPPRYAAAATRPELNEAFMIIMGLERRLQFSEIVVAHERGTMPPTVMWGTCPSQFDPSQAPPGKHTAFMWEKLPYALGSDPNSWDTAKVAHGREMLQLWSRHAPNLAEGAVMESFVQSPLDTERRFPNMRRGDLLIGSFAGGQIGYNRPFPGAGHYRTPISGLYLCGGSTHPGGNITGLCGYNAASVLAADLGLPRWWTPPNLEEALSGLSA